MPAIANKKNQNQLTLLLNANFNWVIIFLVVVFLAGAYLLVIKPKFDTTLLAIKDNIDQQENFYQSQKSKIADLQAAAAMYRKIDEINISKVNTILPNNYAKEKLFGELEDLIAQQGLLLNSLTLNKSGEDSSGGVMAITSSALDMPNADKIGVVNVAMSLGAIDYAALKNLLHFLESNAQLIDIQNLSFDPGGKTAMLNFNTYYFK